MEKPLTQHIKNDGTWLTLKEYESVGGYHALRTALKMAPKDVIKTVKDSGLKAVVERVSRPEKSGSSYIRAKLHQILNTS